MKQSSETVLWYCPDPILDARAKKVFFARRIRVRAVSAGQGGHTVAALLGAGETGGAPAAAPLPNESVMLLSGFTGPSMDGLFAALREGGVGRVALKAVLTPTNASWTFSALCAELKREHEAMGGR